MSAASPEITNNDTKSRAESVENPHKNFCRKIAAVNARMMPTNPQQKGRIDLMFA